MREELKWSLYKEIVHESTITLRINKLPIRKPIYSFEIGVLKEGGYLNRFFPGGLPWDTDFAGIIADLIDQAREHIDEISLKEAEDSARTENERLQKEKDKRSSNSTNSENRRKSNRPKNKVKSE